MTYEPTTAGTHGEARIEALLDPTKITQGANYDWRFSRGASPSSGS